MPLRRALGPVSLALALTLGAAMGVPAARALEKPAGVDLTVVVTDLRSDQGKIKLALWRDAAGFTKPEAAVAKLTVEPLGKVARITIRDLPPGTYALASYHDENGNGKLDKTLIGWPDEGLGFSNGAWIKLGPPSFEDAAITLGAGAGATVISLRY
ncbi:MAG: DUF2141 domain-containing protein [Rhodospirillales bacterium]|nr:DUF2141 domain-containing protein [Rhodospirillales bacterium]